MVDSNCSIEGSRVVSKRLHLSELSCENDSTNCPELLQVSVSPKCQKTAPNLSKWTDEKHSSYIKSLETSFVNQMYDSMDNLGWHLQRERVSKYTSEQNQYKVFKDGSWTRINFRHERPQPNQVYESDNIMSNSWIQHYRLPCKKGSAVTGQIKVEGNAEATDQNFIEEEEKQGRKRDIKSQTCLVSDDFRHDQVVPLYKLPLLGDVNGMDL